MFGPYRTPSEVRPPEKPARPSEEILLAWALVVIGGVRVVFAIASHEVWGTEATLAMLLAMGGVAMFAQEKAGRRRR